MNIRTHNCCILFLIASAIAATNSCGRDNESGNTQNAAYDALSGQETIPSINWIAVEAGTFTFGSDPSYGCHGGSEKQVSVTLTRPFQIASTEITQAQWEALDIPNPSLNRGGSKPVTFISFFEAAIWCNKLSLLERLEPCYNLTSCHNDFATGCDQSQEGAWHSCWDADVNFNCSGDIHKYENWYACPGYRLPTTAEWEYAAKAGVTDTHTYGGDLFAETFGNCGDQTSLNDIAWYCFNSGDELHPVAQKLPNPWGLYDTLGNVYEWTDYFADGQPLDYENPDQPMTDPMGPLSGDMKDLRGGKFDSTGCIVNATWHSNDNPYTRRHDTGFRPVRTIFE